MNQGKHLGAIHTYTFKAWFCLQIMSTQTEPPPRETFSAQVMQWIIYDAYNEDFEAKQLEREKDTKVSRK